MLGRGGNGIVYLALDPELDRKVAIKVLGRGSADSASLLREGRVAGSMAHPNVVRIFDIGDFGDEMFIAMEHLDGSTLADWITEEHPRSQILHVLIQAGRGLSAAHRAGLVHGDFKPKNVMVTLDDRVVVLDFGLGRSIDRDDPDTTSSTKLAGTPAYMAPELYAGRSATTASDQFAYCVALYEAMFGRRPYEVTDLQMGSLDPPTIPRSAPGRFGARCFGVSSTTRRRALSRWRPCSPSWSRARRCCDAWVSWRSPRGQSRRRGQRRHSAPSRSASPLARRCARCGATRPEPRFSRLPS